MPKAFIIRRLDFVVILKNISSYIGIFQKIYSFINLKFEYNVSKKKFRAIETDRI